MREWVSDGAGLKPNLLRAVGRMDLVGLALGFGGIGCGGFSGHYALIPNKEYELLRLNCAQAVFGGGNRLGRSRATMVVTDEGPAISMFEENGRKRLVLSQATAVSGLELFDDDESPVASLTVPLDARRQA